MAVPALTAYSATAGKPISGGRWIGGRLMGTLALAGIVASGSMASTISPLSAQEINANGCHTWFSNQLSLYDATIDSTITATVNSSGTNKVTRFDHSTLTSSEFTLHTTLEDDDHNNGALLLLPDGRYLVLFSKHNDVSGTRYRISTTPHDITAWDAEVVLTVTTPATYSNPRYLSQTGKVYCHYRSGLGGTGSNPMNVRAYDPSTDTWDTERTWLENTGVRPYVQSISNGVNRIDFFHTDRHPDQGLVCGVYHFYMQLDGSGNELFYKSDDTLIGSGPVTPADATLIFNGTKSWCWDVVRTSDGDIHALFAKFVTTTDHRCMYVKCTGGVWGTPVEIVSMGTQLYAGQPYYSNGMCFDREDVTRVAVGVEVGSARELQEFSTSDAGASWSKLRDITSGSTAGVFNCRPRSPENNNGALRYVWWRGTYASYTSFTTALWGVG